MRGSQDTQLVATQQRPVVGEEIDLNASSHAAKMKRRDVYSYRSPTENFLLAVGRWLDESLPLIPHRYARSSAFPITRVGPSPFHARTAPSQPTPRAGLTDLKEMVGPYSSMSCRVSRCSHAPICHAARKLIGPTLRCCERLQRI